MKKIFPEFDANVMYAVLIYSTIDLPAVCPKSVIGS